MAGFFVIFGGAFLYSVVRNSTPAGQSAKTQGTVTQCLPDTGNGFHDVASFVVDGTTYHAEMRTGTSSSCPYDVGTNVTVTYDPANPSSASIPNPTALPMGVVILVGAGLLVAVGLVISIVLRGEA